MRRNGLIIGTAVVGLFSVILLAFYLYSSSRQEILSQFQGHQLGHAKHLADQIDHFFESRSQFLKALSSIIEYDDIAGRKADLQAYSKGMATLHIEIISLYDENGKVVYSTGTDAIGSNYAEEGFFISAKKEENKRKVLIFRRPTDQSHTPNPFLILLVAPLYQKSPSREHFVGALSLTVDLKEFLAEHLSFVEPQAKIHQVWIVDKHGTLLFQSEHPEMVLRNIYKKDQSCLECHVSFDYVERILSRRQGSIDYGDPFLIEGLWLSFVRCLKFDFLMNIF